MDLGATDNPQTGLASMSCLSCKERKQKCDKALRGCSRCERLLLKCHYPKPASPPSPPPSSNGSNGSLDGNEALIQGFASIAARGQEYHGQVLNLILEHRQHFEDMTDTFFNSCHKWVPIVHQESFREYRNATRTDICRGLTTLTLSMCLIARPFMDGETPDPLRLSLHKALSRLFWDPESIAQPTLPLIQSGVILSSYEYGQGTSDAAYMTICTCLSMGQVCGLGKPPPGYDRIQFPLPGIWTPRDEGLRTWWASLIHERMISLKNGALIRPLNIETADILDVAPSLENYDLISISFYCEARAANFLDQVLDLIRNGSTHSSKKQLTFQSLDRSLLMFLKSLIEQHLGTCCEAVAIGVSAFVHLHQWRIGSTDSVFSAQDRLESCDAIESVIKIIANTGTSMPLNFPCQSQYSIQLIYQLSVSIRHLQQNGRSHLENWAKLLVVMLEHQRGRWKIAGEYLSILARN